MAGMNHQRHPVETLSRYRQLLIGRWQPNGASSPAAASLTGALQKVGTVARTGTGVMVFTFSKKPGRIKSVLAQLRGPFTAGDYLQVTAWDEDAGTITITTKDGGGATDIPASENVFIEVWVWCTHVRGRAAD